MRQPPPYQIQALEPDYLDTHRDAQLENGGFIIQGVEYGEHGEKLAYWLHKSHPGEVYHSFASAVTDSVRVPARDVIHLREIYRSGQVRGIPRGTPVLLQLRDFDDYLDAELHRQKIAACFTAFVYDSSGLDGGFGAGMAGSPGVSPTSTGTEGSSELDDFGKLFPGAIKKLPPGTDIRLTAPPTTNGLPDYARLTLHQIAVGYGANYAEMTGDLSQANYSSGRMGHLTFAAENETVQACTLRPQLLDKLWGWHLEALMVTGRISNRVPVEWSFPRRPMVDPNKETKALTEQVQAGFVSLADVQRQLGSDPDEVLDELGQDKDRAEALGLNLSVFTSPPGTVTPNSEPEDQNVGPGDHDENQEGDDGPEAS
ncbi:MAG: phage portal protein [Planctomycetota bacterium]